MDGRRDWERILAVVREIDADVLALQEVESRQLGDDMLDWLARQAGFESTGGATLAHDGGHYGNGLLSRCPVKAPVRPGRTWVLAGPRLALAPVLASAGRL